MERRTFLKAVLATAVAPASCVKDLYRPAIPFGIGYWVLPPEGTPERRAFLLRNDLPPISLDRQVKFKNYVFAFQPPIRR